MEETAAIEDKLTLYVHISHDLKRVQVEADRELWEVLEKYPGCTFSYEGDHLSVYIKPKGADHPA